MRRPTISNAPDFFALREAVARVPGVEAVTSGDLPLGLFTFNRVHKPGADDDVGFAVQVDRVGPRYLSTMKMALARGRDLTDEDVRGASANPAPVIGIRMALGARWSAILRMILRDAVVVVGAGSIAGGILSFGLLRALWPLLTGN